MMTRPLACRSELMKSSSAAPPHPQRKAAAIVGMIRCTRELIKEFYRPKEALTIESAKIPLACQAFQAQPASILQAAGCDQHDGGRQKWATRFPTGDGDTSTR
jgi:hypothetical protein